MPIPTTLPKAIQKHFENYNKTEPTLLFQSDTRIILYVEGFKANGQPHRSKTEWLKGDNGWQLESTEDDPLTFSYDYGQNDGKDTFYVNEYLHYPGEGTSRGTIYDDLSENDAQELVAALNRFAIHRIMGK